MHALNSTVLVCSSKCSLHLLCHAFLLGYNVLLPVGLVINERTPRYFVVCLFLRVWPSHSTQFIEVQSFLENVVWVFSNIHLMQFLQETNGLLSENQLLAS